jgi:RalA-binding protein 1
MSQQPPIINYGQDEISHLRSQNDQLWKIIEKQRVMIQNLQKDNVRLSAERDGLQDQVNILEKEITRKQRVTSLLISPQALREIAEQDDAASTPSSETTPSPVEYTPNTFVTSPMPPPRSPYRPLKEKAEDFGLKMMEQEPESYIMARNIEDNNMNGRSSPGSPAPGPHSPTSPRYQQQQQQQQQQQRKDSAPLPSTNNRNHSPFIVPSPSKSSSSLEVRKARQRDSMLPPARSALEHDPTMRAASPPLPPSSSTFSLSRPNNTTTINDNNTSNTTTATTTTITTTPTTNTNIIHSNSSSTTTNNTIYRGKRESVIFSTSRTDLCYINDDESRQQEEYHHPAFVASSDFTQNQTNTLMGSMANVCIKVVGSNIKPNDKGKEVVSFILSVGVYREEDGEFEERWRVEKLYSDFLSLDSKVRTCNLYTL